MTINLHSTPVLAKMSERSHSDLVASHWPGIFPLAAVQPYHDVTHRPAVSGAHTGELYELGLIQKGKAFFTIKVYFSSCFSLLCWF